LIISIAAVLALFIYEYTMPNNRDIRMDLVLVWLGQAMKILAGLIRGIFIHRYNTTSHNNAMSWSSNPVVWSIPGILTLR